MAERDVGDLIDRVNELLSYDPSTGAFTWRVTRTGWAKAGGRAGCRKKNGYVNISVDGESHGAHRLAWLIMHGQWPKGDLDHINRDPSDNRIDNLREATRAENRGNQKMQSNNSSGYRGVQRCSNSKTAKWVAVLTMNGCRKYLGTYSTPEAAHEVYSAEAVRYFGEFYTT